MELGSILLEIVLALVDAALTGADVYSWWKGKANRHERRAARHRGETLPPRDKWNRRVIALTPGVAVMTGVLVWRWVGQAE